MVLHQFHTILRTRLIVEIPWSDPSISHSLLNDYAAFPDTRLNLSRHALSLSPTWWLGHDTGVDLHQGEKSYIMEDKVRISNEFYTVSLKVIPNDVLSSSKFVCLHAITFCWYSRPTWTAEFIAVDVESTEWYIGNQVKYLIFLRTTQLVKENRRLSQRTHNLWLVDYGIPTRSFKLDFNCLLQFAATPWTVTHITLLQFSATPLRRFVFFPHLRHRYWVWVSVLLQFPATPWLCLRLQNSFWWLLFCYQMSVILRSPHPTSQEQEYRPFTNQHPVIFSRIL